MTPEPKRPLKVFLCHARADRDAVRALYSRLTKDGVDAWLDKEKLLPGQDWEFEIRKAVREADVVVVCLSKQFNQAGFRQKEVRLALDTAMEKPEGEIFIIPARLEECDTLESLRRWHWVDLFEDNGYEMLMRALQARAGKIGATFQMKRSWLPKITTSRSNIEKPIEEKKLATSNKDQAEEVPEKAKREIAKFLKKNERRYRWGMFWIDIQSKFDSFMIELRYRLSLFRIDFLPNMLLLIAVALVVFLAFYLYKNIPVLPQSLKPTSQPSQISTDIFTLTPAETSTPFPTVSFSSCQSTVLGEAFVFDVPSYGGIVRAFLGMNTRVEVIAQLDDSGWYPIKWDEKYGWVPPKTLLLDKECPVVDSLIHLLPFVNPDSFINETQSVVIEDTFSSYKYPWLDQNGSQVSYAINGLTGDNVLELSSHIPGYHKITSSSISSISDPIVVVSMDRPFVVDETGYFGFFFENAVYDNFEIRILRDCTVQVFENMELLVEVSNDNVKTNNCSDQTSDYFEFRVFQKQLDIRVNGQSLAAIYLSKDYGEGSLSFVVEGAIVRIEFVVISTPH